MASSSSLQRSSGGSSGSNAATAMAACSPVPAPHDDEATDQLRRGPWTVDEDLTLVNYIADHGEGRWNSLARAAGLKRTGKSCRLRWLNYLRPDVKRGNFTADEQLLILDLHSRWGNRWSMIAQHLPGRTDNEIKNYWRTRVQKHAKQLNCDANSNKFKDAMRYLWMPRLATAGHRLQQAVAYSVVGDHVVPEPESASAVYDTGSSGLVTSSLDSFVTPESSSSYDRGLTCANVHAGETLDGGDRWTMNEGDQGLWSESTQCAGQFKHDSELTGWVQGFSEGLAENFWSLEDIWKMQ